MKIKEVTERLDYKTVRSWTPEQWTAWLNSQIKAGGVYKGDWTDAKSAINRQIEKAANEANQFYFQLDQVAREPYSDLYWAQPHGMTELGKAEKTAKKSPDGPYKKAVLDLVAVYRPLKDKLDQLKPLIVTAQQRRETVKQQQASEKEVKYGAAEALVSALEANRGQYVDEAGKRAQHWMESRKEELAKRGGIEAIKKPDPELRKTDPKEYARQDKMLQFAHWVDKMPTSEYVRQQRQGAADSYDAWVYKLVQKIGKPVTDADVSGDPWHNSRITVKCRDGEVQTWVTRMILNTSKLGKVFNQFPTRRVQ